MSRWVLPPAWPYCCVVRAIFRVCQGYVRIRSVAEARWHAKGLVIHSSVRVSCSGLPGAAEAFAAEAFGAPLVGPFRRPPSSPLPLSGSIELARHSSPAHPGSSPAAPFLRFLASLRAALEAHDHGLSDVVRCAPSCVGAEAAAGVFAGHILRASALKLAYTAW